MASADEAAGAATTSLLSCWGILHLAAIECVFIARVQMADKEEIGRALMKADRAMNSLARELYSKVRFLLEQVPTLRSVQRFLLKDVSINHGSIWSLEEALLQGQDRPTHSLHLKLCLEREIQV